jgi:tetratricopeptide (TPR) repeat protein
MIDADVMPDGDALVLAEEHRRGGRLAEAQATCLRVLALRPDEPKALHILGLIAQQSGNFVEAIDCLRRALAQAPDVALYHASLGEACRLAGRTEEAVAHARRALELKPDYAEALGNLALALAGLERLDEAAELLRRAIAMEPLHPDFHLRLGFVLVGQGRLEEAEAALQQVLALFPTSHDAFNLLGRVAFMKGSLDAGTAHYRRALELKPDFADAHNGLGHALHALGRFAEAADSYRSALALDQGNTLIHFNLADAKIFTEDDPQLAAMQALACKGDLPERERMFLHFALGKAYADLHQHTRSFEHLLRGNALKRAHLRYDETATLATLTRIEATFNQPLLKKKARHGERSHLPVFILGMPRSGTSLVEQILASHPRVLGAGELTAMDEALGAVRASRGLLPYPDCVGALDAAAIQEIGARYLAHVRGLAPAGTTRVTDKMPSNFLLAGLIHQVLPNARIIHTVRDPVDTCISCFSRLFALEHNYTYDLAELGRYYRAYQRLMAHWHRVLPPGRILNVRYEELVADLDGQARRMVAHCGLDWDDRCLAFHRTQRAVRTASAMQVRQPIYTSSIGLRRHYEPFLGPLLAALGA